MAGGARSVKFLLGRRPAGSVVSGHSFSFCASKSELLCENGTEDQRKSCEEGSTAFCINYLAQHPCNFFAVYASKLYQCLPFQLRCFQNPPPPFLTPGAAFPGPRRSCKVADNLDDTRTLLLQSQSVRRYAHSSHLQPCNFSTLYASHRHAKRPSSLLSPSRSHIIYTSKMNSSTEPARHGMTSFCTLLAQKSAKSRRWSYAAIQIPCL